MHFALESHDSELRDVVADGSVVRLRFAAAAVSDDAGDRGWLASVQLELRGAALHGDATHAFGKITQGALRQSTRAVAPLQVPGTLAGELELTLRLANGTRFIVRANSLTSTVDADARFSPDLSC